LRKYGGYGILSRRIRAREILSMPLSSSEFYNILVESRIAFEGVSPETLERTLPRLNTEISRADIKFFFNTYQTNIQQALETASDKSAVLAATVVAMNDAYLISRTITTKKTGFDSHELPVFDPKLFPVLFSEMAGRFFLANTDSDSTLFSLEKLKEKIKKTFPPELDLRQLLAIHIDIFCLYITDTKVSKTRSDQLSPERWTAELRKQLISWDINDLFILTSILDDERMPDSAFLAKSGALNQAVEQVIAQKLAQQSMKDTAQTLDACVFLPDVIRADVDAEILCLKRDSFATFLQQRNIQLKIDDEKHINLLEGEGSVRLPFFFDFMLCNREAITKNTIELLIRAFFEVAQVVFSGKDPLANDRVDLFYESVLKHFFFLQGENRYEVPGIINLLKETAPSSIEFQVSLFQLQAIWTRALVVEAGSQEKMMTASEQSDVIENALVELADMELLKKILEWVFDETEDPSIPGCVSQMLNNFYFPCIHAIAKLIYSQENKAIAEIVLSMPPSIHCLLWAEIGQLKFPSSTDKTLSQYKGDFAKLPALREVLLSDDKDAFFSFLQKRQKDFDKKIGEQATVDKKIQIWNEFAVKFNAIHFLTTLFKEQAILTEEQLNRLFDDTFFEVISGFFSWKHIWSNLCDYSSEESYRNFERNDLSNFFRLYQHIILPLLRGKNDQASILSTLESIMIFKWLLEVKTGAETGKDELFLQAMESTSNTTATLEMLIRATEQLPMRPLRLALYFQLLWMAYFSTQLREAAGKTDGHPNGFGGDEIGELMSNTPLCVNTDSNKKILNAVAFLLQCPMWKQFPSSVQEAITHLQHSAVTFFAQQLTEEKVAFVNAFADPLLVELSVSNRLIIVNEMRNHALVDIASQLFDKLKGEGFTVSVLMDPLIAELSGDEKQRVLFILKQQVKIANAKVLRTANNLAALVNEVCNEFAPLKDNESNAARYKELIIEKIRQVMDAAFTFILLPDDFSLVIKQALRNSLDAQKYKEHFGTNQFNLKEFDQDLLQQQLLIHATLLGVKTGFTGQRYAFFKKTIKLAPPLYTNNLPTYDAAQDIPLDAESRYQSSEFYTLPAEAVLFKQALTTSSPITLTISSSPRYCFKVGNKQYEYVRFNEGMTLQCGEAAPKNIAFKGALTYEISNGEIIGTHASGDPNFMAFVELMFYYPDLLKTAGDVTNVEFLEEKIRFLLDFLKDLSLNGRKTRGSAGSDETAAIVSLYDLQRCQPPMTANYLMDRCLKPLKNETIAQVGSISSLSDPSPVPAAFCLSENLTARIQRQEKSLGKRIKDKETPSGLRRFFIRNKPSGEAEIKELKMKRVIMTAILDPKTKYSSDTSGYFLIDGQRVSVYAKALDNGLFTNEVDLPIIARTSTSFALLQEVSMEMSLRTRHFPLSIQFKNALAGKIQALGLKIAAREKGQTTPHFWQKSGLTTSWAVKKQALEYIQQADLNGYLILDAREGLTLKEGTYLPGNIDATAFKKSMSEALRNVGFNRKFGVEDETRNLMHALIEDMKSNAAATLKAECKVKKNGRELIK